MVDWWHTFDFPEFKTQGKDNSPEKLKFLGIPENLSGKRVLDIGCWDGYFSFVCEKRGASVLAIDSPKFAWGEELWDGELGSYRKHSGKLGFETAHKALNSKVFSKEMEIIDIRDGEFELVLCLGILYHMKNPFDILEKVFKVTTEGGMCIIETHTDGNYLAAPAMIYYPAHSLNNDPCNYWGPNLSCLFAMLRRVGFKDSKAHAISGNRVVIHAFK